MGLRGPPTKPLTCEASIGVEVASGLASRVWVDPIVEVEEGPNPSSGIANSSEEESIETGVELLQTATGFHSLVEHLNAVQASPKTNASEALTLLKHLSTSLDEIQWLSLYYV